jgi:HD-GYP domain-containing protein (c-di-GMP phosphodiesterase class II)
MSEPLRLRLIKGGEETQICCQDAYVEALVPVAARLNTNLDRATVIDRICEETARALGADIACVIFPGPAGALRVARAAGPGVEDFSRLIASMPDVVSQLLVREAPVIVASPRSTSCDLAWSAVGAQMLRDGKAVGLLVVAFDDGARQISPDARALLGGLADLAGLALSNADLLAELHVIHDTPPDAYDATLESWVCALDRRDRQAEGHVRRVTAMTMRLARAMGFSEDALTHIYRGALLHDIGKLGIPDRILHKPGPLDEKEWSLMRMHPVYAYHWLRPIPLLRPALDIPYYHHEKWDGSGYPCGLRGEAIPLAARIFTLADSWDTLRSDRPYKPAYSEEHSLCLIDEQSGRHFDPDVVGFFLRLLPDLRASGAR